MNDRKWALCKYLELTTKDERDEVTEGYDESSLDYGRESYLVLTDEEADARAKDDAESSLWAFNADFLSSYCKCSAKAIEVLQRELCEDAQEPILAMLGDNADDALTDAISADGRGHFLSGYDGEENDVSYRGRTWFIYRTN